MRTVPATAIFSAVQTAQADLLVKVLTKLGVRDRVVLGHSWGALMAIAFGLRSD
jgi:pimeloyl-ACP methyl ester carboxylesterase